MKVLSTEERLKDNQYSIYFYITSKTFPFLVTSGELGVKFGDPSGASERLPSVASLKLEEMPRTITRSANGSDCAVSGSV